MTKNTLWGIILDEQLYSEALRAKFVHSSGERFAALIRSATWTERMVRVSDVARMARPKLRRCAHTCGVFTRRRSERAPREIRSLSKRAIRRADSVGGMDRADGVRLRCSPLTARPKLWPCAHTRGVFTRRRSYRAPREIRSLSGRAIRRADSVGGEGRTGSVRLRCSPLTARPNSGRAPTRAACSRVAAQSAPRDSPLRSPARRHGQSGWCASQAFPVDGAAKTLAVRPHARCVHASPLRVRPARNSYAHQASDMS